jgi:putative tryptophan/tyrosine transport system substrate-binding protein
MRWREFLGLAASIAVLPVVARAQQTAMPVIGFLNGGSPEGYARMAVAFRCGLNEARFIEGQNALSGWKADIWGSN